MEIKKLEIPGTALVIPELRRDKRGFFFESFRADKFKAAGLPYEFCQDNHSGSCRGTVRGLHFQYDPPMGKLMRVTKGEAFLVAVDIRKGSPTLGQWVGVIASEFNYKQLWAEAGFARGFYAMTAAEVQYKCTAPYNSNGESGILWNDPALKIDWPTTQDEVLISDKDAKAQTLEQWLARLEANAFQYRAKSEIGMCDGPFKSRGPGPTVHTGPHVVMDDCRNWEPI